MSETGIVNNDEDKFKNAFKYFKQKKSRPDFSTVIDFQDELNLNLNGIQRYYPKTESVDSKYLSEAGMQQLIDWRIYKLEIHPGLFFICNPFTEYGVEYWIQQSFEKFCHPPNPTNLDKEIKISETCDDTIMRKLRWATLGYHHNWDTKEYEETYKGEFPTNLHLLSNCVSKSIGFENFKAEAAIVNYYAFDSSIGGHTDHSEKNHNAPLISISFGHTGLFLLGGVDKSIAPTPMFIHNGDIVVMSGSTRLCYHGVPRIIPNPKFSINGRWSNIMSKMRVNLNVRQVNF